ncbi:MAG TPA: sulfotransferase [Actinomadura sp.]|nr:sulfotransferase [Actinomadura sp.]
MTLRLIGAGLGRTGTYSLKMALQRLLGEPCYHMAEVFAHPGHVPLWQAAVRGEPPAWDQIFHGYVATVDWPAAAFWRELAETYPGTTVLLSLRRDADAWWRSAKATIFEATLRPAEAEPDLWRQMILELWDRRFTERWWDERSAKAAYEGHNDEVRATIASDRLVEWCPGDGWAPICAALGVPVPDRPFPHVNTTAEFREMAHGGPPPDRTSPV